MFALRCAFLLKPILFEPNYDSTCKFGVEHGKNGKTTIEKRFKLTTLKRFKLIPYKRSKLTTTVIVVKSCLFMVLAE